jgi:hypothetical protein
MITPLIGGTTPAHAVVYCTYIDYPPRCVARPGVVLRPRGRPTTTNSSWWG